MSDLQDLIDQWDNSDLAARAYPETFIQGFLEAARKVANPDIEAGAKAAYEHVHGGDRWEDAEPLDQERFIGEATVTIAAALGVTENADEVSR